MLISHQLMILEKQNFLIDKLANRKVSKKKYYIIKPICRKEKGIFQLILEETKVNIIIKL